MQRRNRFPLEQTIAVLILAVLVIINSSQSLSTLSNQLTTIYHNIGQPGVWRGAAYFGQEFANLVAFLNQETPPGARVVIPPRGVGFEPLTRTQNMRYFLYPRSIINCTGDYQRCMQEFLDEPNTYVVIAETGGISAFLAELPRQRVRMMNPKYGLLVPAGSSLESGQALQLYPSLFAVSMAVFWSVLFLGGLGLAGGLLLDISLPELVPLQIVGLGFGVGSGVFSVLLTLPLLAGLQLTASIVFGVYFLLLAFSTALHFLKKRPPRLPGFLSIRPFQRESWLLPVLGFAVIVMVLAFGLGYHRDDALGIWAPIGYGIATAGFPEGPTYWGTLTTEYPLHIPVLIAAMRTIFTENLPESKLIFPFYAVSTLVIVYAYFREKTPGITASLSALLIGTTPTFFNQSYVAYANLSAAYFFIAGVLLWQRSTDRQVNTSGLQLTGGVFIALSAWTRPEIILIGVVATTWFVWRELRRGLSWMDVVRIGSPMVGYLIFWSVIKRVAYAQSGFLSGTFSKSLAMMLQGQFHLSSAYQVLKFAGQDILSIDVWGMVGWSVLLGIASLFLFRRRPVGLPSTHLVIACLFILGILGGYYLISFNPARPDLIKWWPRNTLYRSTMPGVLLLWMAIVRRALTLSQPGHNSPSPGVLDILSAIKRR